MEKKQYVIRDLTTQAYFYAIEILGTYVFYTKKKEEAPRYDENRVFKMMDVLRKRGARVIHEAV